MSRSASKRSECRRQTYASDRCRRSISSAWTDSNPPIPPSCRAACGHPRGSGARQERFPGLGIGSQLPHVSSNLLAGLMEAVAAAPFNGKADLPEIASDLQMEIDELFPVAETLQMLRFAELEGGDLKLTEEGMAFARSELDERKRIFTRHLLTYVPLAAHIRRVFDERASHSARKSRIVEEFEAFS